MVNQIYPSELQFIGYGGPVSGFTFDYSDGFNSSNIDDIRDDFDFDIVNFPFQMDIPRATYYRVYISHSVC